ncbi:hypothetical protein [Kordiimonas lacus]|uniref:EF hand n=1 Tax=Kordiimonas lacus TaxID=637679 RepID=A0A1G7DH69_9PROT|nr:hypothetical protein [Kordiimonas lacus]SDE50380.1 hypothetical protein SAMN04488071_3095 [Kordiimonas lacus]
MRVRPIHFIIFGAAFGLGACASGPDRGRGGPPQMDMNPEAHAERVQQVYRQYVERWDYNGDGEATCEDINVQRSRLFRVLDENKDGKLVSGEYRHAKFEDKSFMFFDFLRVDTNGTAAVELEELVAVPHSQFLNADNDGDCYISPPEAMAMMRDMQMGAGGAEGRGPGGRGGKGGRAPRGGGPMVTGD